jgi:hypothetical protein
LPCVNETSSGIKVKAWVHRLVEWKISLGFHDGPAISDIAGRVLTCTALDDVFTEILEDIYDDHPQLFGLAVKDKEEVAGSYQVYRTPRRSSVTRAAEQKVSREDIELINRWHMINQSEGSRPSFSNMRQHYVQADLLLQPYLRYTVAM